MNLVAGGHFDNIAFILCINVQLATKARALSERLSLDYKNDFNETDVDEYLKKGRRYYIEFGDTLVCLKCLGLKQHGPIFSDFLSKSLAYRRFSGGIKKEAIAKAIGVNKNFRPQVTDLTAGLGNDAFILASLGCLVTLVERNPVIYSLLENGFERAADYGTFDYDIKDIVNRMMITYMDGDSFLSTYAGLTDVIYLDPMYQKRRKSAAVRKEMQAFHSIVGMDDDAPSLLRLALKKARYRVVVKRPLRAQYLDNHPPSYSIRGKTTRFDIFVISPSPH